MKSHAFGIKISLLVVFTFIFLMNITAQKKDQDSAKFKTISIAFYNVENFYDTIDNPATQDEEFLPRGPKNWNTKRYFAKLNNMTEIISKLGMKNPPVVMGFCEVESKSVLVDIVKSEKLKKYEYGIVHYDSPDLRGVDVGLIYQKKVFQVTSSKKIPVKIPEDSTFKTRDMLLVSGLLEGESFHFMVAHWSSRRGGEKISRPKRVFAANVARAVIDSIIAREPMAKIIFMGDLNDDPKSISVTDHMHAVGKMEKMTDATLFNPMFAPFKKGIGTLAWQDSWNLFDQMLLTKPLMENNFNSYQFFGVRIFNEPFVKQYDGAFKGYPFRTYAGDSYLGGYSDHFPVYLLLVKKYEQYIDFILSK